MKASVVMVVFNFNKKHNRTSRVITVSWCEVTETQEASVLQINTRRHIPPNIFCGAILLPLLQRGHATLNLISSAIQKCTTAEQGCGSHKYTSNTSKQFEGKARKVESEFENLCIHLCVLAGEKNL